MSKPIYVLNGPNLNLLGKREPEVYGRESLDDVRACAESRAKGLGLTIVFRQSNAEGELVTWIQEAREKAQGIILTPAPTPTLRLRSSMHCRQPSCPSSRSTCPTSSAASPTGSIRTSRSRQRV